MGSTGFQLANPSSLDILGGAGLRLVRNIFITEAVSRPPKYASASPGSCGATFNNLICHVGNRMICGNDLLTEHLDKHFAHTIDP